MAEITDQEISEIISAALTQALAGPKVVEGDAGRIEQHDVDALIKARASLQSTAVPTGPRRGLRYSKHNLPGAF